MTEVSLDSLFPVLEGQAARLNKASDDANRVLSAVEKRLVDMNIGLEFWYRIAISKEVPEGDFGPHKTSSQIGHVVGLARVDGKWRLAVKAMRKVSGFYEGDLACPFENEYAAGPASALASASRELRIAALRAMPEFLAKLNEHVAATNDELESAAGQVTGPRGPQLVK